MKLSNAIRDEIQDRGFSVMRSTDFGIPSRLHRCLDSLIAECRALPPDPKARNGERRRRHGRYVYLPWLDKLNFRPVTSYAQDLGHNPEDGGVAREFAPLTEAMRANRFLEDLIRSDFNVLTIPPKDRLLPWDVGVHVVQMFARPGIPGLSSPDCLHKDGEPFTFVHLLERSNITGGESVVADNHRRVVFETTLTELMDSLVVRDEAVFHQVKRIEVLPCSRSGFRTVLLIDFTPMRPYIVPASA